jgi:hypothetical protein
MRIELHYSHDEAGRPHGTLLVGDEVRRFTGLMQLLRMLEQIGSGGRPASMRNHPSGRYPNAEAS